MDRCSVLSAAAGEPLAGTAPVAQRWLCVEHDGPWGVRAAETDPVLAELARRASVSGTRLELVRQPGRRVADGTYRLAFLADTRPGATRLSTLELTDPAELLDLDLASPDPALPHRTPPFSSRHHEEPLLLVCSHGRRDQCCAIAGRALAASLPAAWECTHLTGHRFAPNAVVLPTGYLYGRLDSATLTAALAAAAAGRVTTQNCRGRSTWEPAGQVAELAVRALSPELPADTLLVHSSDGGSTVRVDACDGRSWQVQVTAAPLALPRPTSCGAEPTPAAPLVATDIRELSPAAPGTAAY